MSKSAFGYILEMSNKCLNLQEAVGKVYEEFVSTFEDNPHHKLNKTWVKAGTFNAGNRREDTTDKGKLYKPQAKIEILPKESTSKPLEKVRQH